jgi:deoxyxylulose-5-phosphate synthase
MHAIKVI